MITSPCQGCDERQIGCHGKCSKYKQFKKDVEADKQRIIEKNRTYPSHKAFYKLGDFWFWKNYIDS